MDPVFRAALVICAAVAIKAFILARWDAYKARKALEPIPMRQVNGVYIAWGPVQRIRHWGWRATQLWLVYIAVLLVALVSASV